MVLAIIVSTLTGYYLGTLSSVETRYITETSTITITTTTTAKLTITETTKVTLAPKPPVKEHGFVEIGGRLLLVEIADTQEERARGLSRREKLEEGWGMLFVFEKAGIYSFWMYEMLFPLDIIWINEKGEIVYIVEKAEPCKSLIECKPYTPDKPALYVLEVNAGFTEQNNITIGMKTRIYLPVV